MTLCICTRSESLQRRVTRMEMNAQEQREITELAADAGLLLMQYGAETTLAELVVKRVAAAYGLTLEVAITASALTLSSLHEGQGATTVRRILDRGINMSVTTEVQRLMLEADGGRLSRREFREGLDRIKPYHYPRALLIPAVGASCAAFAYLARADWPSCALVWVASSAAMAVRLSMAGRHYRPLVSFFVAAFVATAVTALGVRWGVGATPKPAMASSVLLLVPGFPLINGISDMVKGHINVGISRVTMALLLSASTCVGVILAMTLTHVWGWL